MITFQELRKILDSVDVLDNRTFVVEYAMAPYYRRRLITEKATILKGFFLDPTDIIYSVKEW